MDQGTGGRGETENRLEAFREQWERLVACCSTANLSEQQLKIRFRETWRIFSRMKPGVWERTVTHFIDTAGDDPWMPTPGQLEAARDRSQIGGLRTDELSAEEKHRLRQETQEWLKSPEVKDLGKKTGE